MARFTAAIVAPAPDFTAGAATAGAMAVDVVGATRLAGADGAIPWLRLGRLGHRTQLQLWRLLGTGICLSVPLRLRAPSGGRSPLLLLCFSLLCSVGLFASGSRFVQPRFLRHRQPGLSGKSEQLPDWVLEYGLRESPVDELRWTDQPATRRVSCPASSRGSSRSAECHPSSERDAACGS